MKNIELVHYRERGQQPMSGCNPAGQRERGKHPGFGLTPTSLTGSGDSNDSQLA